MDLRTGTPVWPLRSLQATPPEELPDEVEIIVIGAGTSGAFVAHELVRSGHEVLLLDKETPASGSTRACTAIIQYELDITLEALVSKIGFDAAKMVIDHCRTALDDIRTLAHELPSAVACFDRPALYLASTKDDAVVLERERSLRQSMNVEVELLSSGEIRSKYPFDAPAALYHSEALELNPVELTLGLIETAVQRGLTLCDSADVVACDPNGAKVQIRLRGGREIRCSRVVIAAGYATYYWLPSPKGKLSSTYAAATPPSTPVVGWADRAVVWESARPYHYLRRTEDNRVLIGGRDKPFRNAFLRDILLPLDSYLLRKKLRTMLDDPTLTFTNAWCGTFSESDDGLPFIGTAPDEQRIFYVLASGGNGVTFSALAARMVRAWIQGASHPMDDIVSVCRKA